MIKLTYFLCFFIFSFLGWLVECIFSLIRTGKISNRKTMIYLPLCPVYGISVTILFAFKPFLLNNFVLYFIAGFIICTTVEYLFNEFFKKTFSIKLWDYSNLKLNLNGNICLSYSIIWGVLSTLILYFYPKIISYLSAFPKIISYFLLFIFILDLIESFYYFKHGAINSIKSFCPVADENK